MHPLLILLAIRHAAQKRAGVPAVRPVVKRLAPPTAARPVVAKRAAVVKR